MNGQLSTYLTMSPDALSAPLWTFPAGDALLVIRARRRVLGAESALLMDADERVTDFAETDPE
ncbi:hypothetical protein [Streptomyces sp. CdTB01]|uniref:hypothetical protein n=1 Tax=Streptomyces sp. CdTB01 TaxID=1725411 RepID=UPI00073ABCA8|nr:hypothetical protein [Streptomyces sp. CdTB01]ALV35739.1 hypothetical protein AS200_29630 [Streptomyces sp. CdTB01]